MVETITNIAWKFPLGVIFLVTIISVFLLKRKVNRLQFEKNILLQEKEATIGFVQNVGEVFTDSEDIEMNVLRYNHNDACCNCALDHGAFTSLPLKP